MYPLSERYSDLLGEGADPALIRLVSDLDAACAPHPLPPYSTAASVRPTKEQTKMHGTIVIAPAPDRLTTFPLATPAPRRIVWAALLAAAAVPLVLLIALLLARGRPTAGTLQPATHGQFPQGRSVVAPVRGASNTPAQARTARIVYVALGDNLTTGDEGFGPIAASYPALLARHLPKGARYLNLGSFDNEIHTVVFTDLPTTLAAHATLVTIMLGYSDLAFGGNTPPAAYKTDLDTILAALQRSHARVFIGNIPDLRLSQIAVNRAQAKNGLAYNAIITAEARRRGAVVIDVYAASKTIWGEPAMIAEGGDVPNARGEAVLASLFYRVMHSHGAL